MARPNKRQIIEDNLENIKQWTLAGLTLKQIAKNLGVAESTLYKYKADAENFPELDETIKSGRAVNVQTLENTMYESANGFTRTVKKYAKVKRCKYENGKKAEEWEEMVEYEETIYYPPDTTAGIFLLKNWGGYMNEPATVNIRKEEVELRRKQVEANLW